MRPLLQPAFFLPLAWMSLNLLQAFFTELSADEAYYWMYSRFPDWGYFDHPPMVALFIRAGYSLFENELGVRLVTVIAELLSFALIWSLIRHPEKEKHRAVFWLIAASVPLLQVYGFITTPDVPLLLFSALFLFLYRRFLEKKGWSSALLLGLSMALLLYSKYHGLVLLACVVLSNFKLLRDKFFYLASFFGLVLLLPHFWWQFSHGFPSIHYHFYWRTSEFKFDHVTGYVLAQLFVFGPFMLPFLFYFRRKKLIAFKEPLDRAMLFVLVGVIVLFFLFSFRTRIEAHWTLICTVPLLYFAFRGYLELQQNMRKRFVALMAVSAILVTGARSILFFDILPVKSEFHRTDVCARQVQAAAGSDQVIFTSSYQRASVYSFYTKQLAYSLNDIFYRQNQFNIWRMPESLSGKPVTVFAAHPIGPGTPQTFILLANGDTMYTRRYASFEAAEGVRAELPEVKQAMHYNDTLSLSIRVRNIYNVPLRFENPDMPLVWKAYFCKFGKMIHTRDVRIVPAITGLKPLQEVEVLAKIPLPEADTYNLGLSLMVADYARVFSGNMTLVEIK